MSNIYLKVTIEKNWRSQDFDFLNFKNSSPGQFLRASTHADFIEFENYLLHIENQRSRSKIVCDFSVILILEGIMTF